MLTATQRGVAGEELFSAVVTLSLGGDLELFNPLTDDDHTDVSAGKRGRVPALAIQVKTALSLDRQGFAVARMSFPEGKPREHPAFCLRDRLCGRRRDPDNVVKIIDIPN